MDLGVALAMLQRLYIMLYNTPNGAARSSLSGKQRSTLLDCRESPGLAIRDTVWPHPSFCVRREGSASV